MGRTGESPRRLTDSGFNPVWSPEGSEVLYATENVVDNPFSRLAPSQLFVVKVATGEKRRVSEGDAVQPSWSPHGGRIAYWARSSGGGQRDIYTMPAAGGEAVPVTSDAALDWNPVWSPDGRYLYFSSNRGGSMNLWRVPIDEQSGKTLGQSEPITTRLAAAATSSGPSTRTAAGFSSSRTMPEASTILFGPQMDRGWPRLTYFVTRRSSLNPADPGRSKRRKCCPHRRQANSLPFGACEETAYSPRPQRPRKRKF